MDEKIEFVAKKSIIFNEKSIKYKEQFFSIWDKHWSEGMIFSFNLVKNCF